MNKFINIIPIVFILLGLGCLTITSSVFHSPNSLHHYLESFIGICIFMIIPVIFVLGMVIFVRRKKR
ncbi:hypothetical protein [Metabacillus herbersteinensis]|uniref:hypothetical protein n=1 Tax=Metabacillus herbersteinensis TaxID=283816 RepID=UPI00366CBF56